MSYEDGDGANAAPAIAKKPTDIRGTSPRELANLKLITPETARLNQAKAVQSRLLNLAIQAEFKLNAKAFQKVMGELPQLSSLDVLRMAVHTAIAKDNWEDAARYAALLAEFEAPKLQRIESTVTTKTSQMTDDELKRIIEEEGLSH